MNKEKMLDKNLLRIAGTLIFASCLLVSGCGEGSGPYSMVKVSGQVLYEDGTTIPAESIMIRFDSLADSIDAKTHPRPGIATAGADGAFDVVTTKKYADGIAQGKHKVQMSATDAKGKDLIPAEYGRFETTPLEVDTSEAPFEFRVPKP